MADWEGSIHHCHTNEFNKGGDRATRVGTACTWYFCNGDCYRHTANAMLGVTFPVIALFGDGFGFWPLLTRPQNRP
ncbi:MAG: hypothetical protein HY847_00865 [Betaproteobacteria bacterium]|nr:hypothetical protein [Betaproteobacteria bacterium]